jgi:MinD-like ATPase involved in chromosome partitioning or flagellar assembly
VVFASLTGGAGRSTAAALMCAAAVDAGGPVLLLDATGEAGSDLATRAGGAGTRRDWTRLTGAEAETDFAALRRRRGGGTDGAVYVVAIGGDAGSPPPAEAVAAGAAAAARSWPLVLVDIPHGRSAVRAAVRARRVDLLVMVCRGDPAEIADSGEFLRDLTASGDLDCAQRALVAVRADRRGLPAAARRALAGVCDTAAGPLTLAHVARLTGRRSTAQGPEAVAAGRLLAAAAGVTPTNENVTEEH